MKRRCTLAVGLLVAMLIVCFAGTGLARIPEPDVIYYGKATVRGGIPAAKGDLVELKLKGETHVLASYAIDPDKPLVGPDDNLDINYALRVPMDAIHSITGRTAQFYVAGALANKDKTYVIQAKGSVVSLDLDTIAEDEDNDGMDDHWEITYFGTLDRDGDGDMDGDGDSDKIEYQNNTNPTAVVWENGEACIAHPVMLQNALTDAEKDGIDNVIKLQTGDYVGNFTYTAVLGEDFDLEIIGGLGQGCTAADTTGSLSELNGNAQGSVLALDTATGSSTGSISVSNLFVTNGNATEGGGISVVSRSGDVSLLNNIIADNQATQSGGGIALHIEGAGATVLVANNTIDGNDGGGIYCNSSKVAARIFNNIVTNTIDGEGIRAEGVGLISDYNLFYNNAGGDYSNPDLKGKHDITADPLFFDAAENDYRITAGSPCIDAGMLADWLPEYDIAGKPRIADGNDDNIFFYRVDMGAYELDVLRPPGDCDPVGDVDCDTVLNDSDTCPGYDDINEAHSDNDGVPDVCDPCPKNDDHGADQDGDGMADCWEELYGVDDPNADNDNDKFSNLREFLAGTDPTVETDAPDNLPPSVPEPEQPVNGSEVTEIRPVLKVLNAEDDDLMPPTYKFEIYTSQDLTTPLAESLERPQGATGSTSWMVTVDLVENTFYSWRARARDGEGGEGPWSSFSTFLVNEENDPPAAPELKSPLGGDEVTTRMPTLVVDNAEDPERDGLTYIFEIDPAETFDSGQGGEALIKSKPEEISTGTEGTMTWTAPELDDNMLYFWRARAVDEHGGESGWTTAESFFVNAINDAPLAPNISSPPDDAQVPTTRPVLVVTNASDPDGDLLKYEFELYARVDYTYVLVTYSGPVAEGEDGTTSWQVDLDLEKNQRYWWQARAIDEEGKAGPWNDPMSRFKVVTTNAAPEVPEIVIPKDGAAVQSLLLSLLVLNSSDPDGDAVSYYFNIDKVNTFDSTGLQRSGRLPEGVGGLTSWHPALPLTDRTTYYWRVIAFDGAAYSDWTQGSFAVDMANDPPTEPAIVSPADGSELQSLTSSLVVENSSDENQDAIYYYFEIDKSAEFKSNDLQQSPRLPESAGSMTSWRPAALSDHTKYYWRVVCHDGASYSDWVSGSFSINLANDPPETPTIQSPGDGSHVAALSPVLKVNEAADADGDALTYDYEVCADANGIERVRAVQGVGPSWQLDTGLEDNRYYWWRFRARDDKGAESDWSSLYAFFVNTVNDAPSAPSINYPQHGRVVATRMPMLAVNNAADVDDSVLTYEFEIDTLSSFSSDANQFGSVSQGGLNSTTWIPVDLADHTLYYWRARACDGENCSRWMATASFFVNILNETPVIPSISSPPDGSEVATTRPTLEVNNATNPDGDRLTYEFEVYGDKNKNWRVYRKTGVLEEEDGTTSWRLCFYLKKYRTYWWRVQARDALGEASGWSALHSFKVDTRNRAPEAPVIVSPADGGELATLKPVLEVENAVDSSRDTLTYWFEIDRVNNFDSLALQLSPEIDEDAGHTTTWQPADLEDNTVYYWRARAYDGEAFSAWRTGVFYVNTENDAPFVPTVFDPDESSIQTGTTSILSVYLDTDPDLDAITFDYELYSKPGLSSDDLVTSATDAGNAWTVDVGLTDQAPYYLRSRAVDEHGLESEWTTAAAFSVHTKNARPGTPIINNPFNFGVVTTLTPTLSVNNAVDADDEQLTYEFELFADRGLTEKVASARLLGGDQITAWTVDKQLVDKKTYYWRARANDGDLPGSWMNTAIFMVDTEGAETRVLLACAQDVMAEAETAQIVKVTRKGSPLYGVSLEIPAGALEKDCTVTIGMVENPPALPKNIKAIGGVLDFGPDGSSFAVPITVRIPYTKASLYKAGVKDPKDLQVMTFNPVTLAWETIAVDHVDGWDLIYNVNHFSLYTTGQSMVPETVVEDVIPGGGGGGGGAGCFIDSAGRAGKGAAGVVVILLVLSGGVWVRRQLKR